MDDRELLRVLLVNDAGERVVWRPDFQPPPATLGLMATLGVEVQVVGAHAKTKTGSRVVMDKTIERGQAWQDHRASLARASSRDAAGDPRLRRCGGCRCEVDILTPRHAPTCKWYRPPVAEQRVDDEVRGTERMQTKNGTVRVSTAVHSTNGGLTAGEMRRRWDERREAGEITIRCGIDDCGWTVTKAFGEARAEAQAHRERCHPDHKPAPRPRGPKHLPASGRKLDGDEGLEALERMDAGEKRAPLLDEPEGRTLDVPVDAAASNGTRRAAELGSGSSSSALSESEAVGTEAPTDAVVAVPTDNREASDSPSALSEPDAEHLTPSEPGQGSQPSRVSSGDARHSPAPNRGAGAPGSLSAPAPPRRPKSDRWDNAEIIAAIQAWAAERGAPPTVTQWLKGAPGRPTPSTVSARFGSWSAGIRAAGFEPRTQGGQKGLGEPETRVPRGGASEPAHIPASAADDPRESARVGNSGSPSASDEVAKQEAAALEQLVARTVTHALERAQALLHPERPYREALALIEGIASTTRIEGEDVDRIRDIAREALGLQPGRTP